MNVLLEIGLEEIPARFLNITLKNMKTHMEHYLKENRINFNSIKTYGTPRRLIILINNLSEKQKDLNILNQGPAKEIAYSSNGDLTKAGIGFLKSQKIKITDLEIVEKVKGEYIAARKFIEGIDTIKLLPEALKTLIEELKFSKSMRWADKKFKFVRPIQWILAMTDNSLIDFEVAGCKSGLTSRGHRFFGKKEFLVTSIEDYFIKIKKNNVIIDIKERKDMIVKMLNETCVTFDEKILLDKNLLDEVTNLVEYPFPILASFNPEFLVVPQDVLIITMQIHQRYFPILDSSGNLLPKFILIRNGIEYSDKVRLGNEKVLSARLSDARFFYQEDLKKPLFDNVEKLKHVIFQKDLGTIYQKMVRCKKIATHLINILNLDKKKEGILRTIELSKADLVSHMIGEKEFTKLQGFMGRDYALKSDEKESVALGIEEQYYPRYSGDKLPKHIEGIITGICDRVDTLVGCFGIGLIPSSSKDPFALRRAALGLISIILDSRLIIGIENLIDITLEILISDNIALKKEKSSIKSDLIEFINQRIINILLDKNYRKDFILAILDTENKNLLEIENKLNTLYEVSSNKNFNELVLLLKRIENISKSYTGKIKISKELLKEKPEIDLYDFYINFIEESKHLLIKNDYTAYLNTIVLQKDIINNFFDNIMVMDENRDIKNNRLSLLTSLNTVFSKIANLNLIDTKQNEVI